MKDFRIALVQCSPDADGSPRNNLSLFDKKLRETTDNGADLICFPEVSLSGYVQDPDEVKSRSFTLNDPIVSDAVTLSQKYATFYSFGMFEKSDCGVFNTYLLAGKGKLIGSYQKIHVPARESGSFVPGHRFEVFDLPFATVGFSICYDNEFCESHMILTLMGAELIVMPYAWAEHWERVDYIEACTSDEEIIRERQRWMYMMFGTRSRDTGTYSAMVDHSGIEAHGPWRFVGKSMVFAPTGKVLAETEGWHEETIYADVKGKLLEDYRDMYCYVLKSRRPDAYNILTEPF